VTLDAARTKANEIAHEGLGDLGQSLRNTPRAERIMAIAHREAHELRDIETNIEHILLAILQENRGIGRQVLNELAVKCDKLKTDLLANMRTKAKE
jgi:ATP-dependent Clp protease ATP-binding subunit ClpA